MPDQAWIQNSSPDRKGVTKASVYYSFANLSIFLLSTLIFLQPTDLLAFMTERTKRNQTFYFSYTSKLFKPFFSRHCELSCESLGGVRGMRSL